MNTRRTILFLALAVVFAATHYIATQGAFYWYFWWFDIIMHFWGGILLGLGVHVICSFSRVHVLPTTVVVLSVLAAATVTWELFEWSFGLYLPEGYLIDTATDIFLGFSGGLLTHQLLKTDKMGEQV